MTTTLIQIKQRLYAALAEDPDQEASPPVDDLTHVVRVYRFDPNPGDGPKPVFIGMVTRGLNAEHYLIGLNIYVSVENGAQLASDWLDTTIEEVDALVPDDLGPSDWTVGYNDIPDLWVAQMNLEVGRDYF